MAVDGNVKLNGVGVAWGVAVGGGVGRGVGAG